MDDDLDHLISKFNALAHYNRDKMWEAMKYDSTVAAVYLGKWTAFEEAVKEVQSVGL